MEILFKNSYTRNKELAKEIYRFYYFRRKLAVLFYALFAFAFLLNIVLLALGKSYNVGAFVVGPLYFVFQLCCYFIQVNTMVKRDYEIHGKEIEVETIVTDTYIQNTASTGGVNQIEFAKIRYAIQTKNMILLRSKANLIYIFRKDTFEIGTKEEFVSFLKEKGITVKGK